MEEVMLKDVLTEVNQEERVPWTPIITIYGEYRVKLGDKVYTVKAPEGVTIREECDHEGWGGLTC